MLGGACTRVNVGAPDVGAPDAPDGRTSPSSEQETSPLSIVPDLSDATLRSNPTCVENKG